MKVTFNSLGQIVGGIDYEGQTIRQGSTEIVLKAVFQDKLNINYNAKFNLTRSDGTNITNVTMNLGTDSNSYIFALNDEWYFAKSGQTTLTVFLVDGNGTQIATGQVQFNVQANDYDEEPETITEEQYNSLLAQLNGKASVSQVVLGFSSMPTSTELQSLQVGQIFAVVNGDRKLYKVVEVSGTKVADEIFDFSKFPDFTKQEIEEIIDELGENLQQQIDDNKDDADAHFSDINDKIPSEASSSNKLADKDWTLQKINEEASYKITKNIQGQNFATFSELENATTFYSGGAVRVPTRNDYAYVIEDETHNGVTTKYTYQGGTYPTGRWEFDVEISETPLTDEQWASLNSGATENLINFLKNGEIQYVSTSGIDTIKQLYDKIGNAYGFFRLGHSSPPYFYYLSYTSAPSVSYTIVRMSYNHFERYNGTDNTKTLDEIFNNYPLPNLATRYEYFTKDLIDTTSTDLSDNDSRVPSSKLVKKQLDDIKRVAVANSNSFITSSNYTINNISSKIDTFGYKVKHYDNVAEKWLEFADSQEFEEWAGQKPLLNNKLNSQEDILGATDLTQYGTGFIYVEDDKQSGYVITLNDFSKLFVVGDNLFIIETDVPDRWWEGDNFYILETKDIRKTNNTWTGNNTFNETVAFRGDTFFTNDEIKTGGGDTLNIPLAIASTNEQVYKLTSSVVVSPFNNQFIICRTALSSLLINALQKVDAFAVGQWRITFKAASNFVLTLPSAKTFKWAEGEPIWNTTDTYTLVITEGIDTDYIIYVVRG